ncbi:MAG: DUF1638 domain-containing protein [Armatimonadetes bacterium]|nr:DUF1638 domain-containing protein [Armatimonadota bacterium]
MKLYAIACEAVARECYRAAAVSPHAITISIKEFGLHNEPDDLRAAIQQEIDRASSAGKYDYILLAYGLCSRGTADLIAREVPIVIPRAHDCITLFLGSQERYQREFAEHPGTYYYSPGWVERKEGEVNQGDISIVKNLQTDERFREYVEKYGEDNARYLIEQESLWLSNYDRAVFINMGLGDVDFYRRFTQQVAQEHGWSYEERQGNMRLVDLLFRGDWDPSEFLIVHPGQRTTESVNSGIISVIGD